MNFSTLQFYKGREKGQLLGISFFWIEAFLKEVLGLLLYEGTTLETKV